MNQKELEEEIQTLKQKVESLQESKLRLEQDYELLLEHMIHHLPLTPKQTSHFEESYQTLLGKKVQLNEPLINDQPSSIFETLPVELTAFLIQKIIQVELSDLQNQHRTELHRHWREELVQPNFKKKENNLNYGKYHLSSSGGERERGEGVDLLTGHFSNSVEASVFRPETFGETSFLNPFIALQFCISRLFHLGLTCKLFYNCIFAHSFADTIIWKWVWNTRMNFPDLILPPRVKYFAILKKQILADHAFFALISDPIIQRHPSISKILLEIVCPYANPVVNEMSHFFLEHSQLTPQIKCSLEENLQQFSTLESAPLFVKIIRVDQRNRTYEMGGHYLEPKRDFNRLTTHCTVDVFLINRQQDCLSYWLDMEGVGIGKNQFCPVRSKDDPDLFDLLKSGRHQQHISNLFKNNGIPIPESQKPLNIELSTPVRSLEKGDDERDVFFPRTCFVGQWDTVNLVWRVFVWDSSMPQPIRQLLHGFPRVHSYNPHAKFSHYNAKQK